MPQSRLRHRFAQAVLLASQVVVFGITTAGRAGAADSMELVLHTSGTVSQDIEVRRNLDDAHSCALDGPPGQEQTLTLAFNQHPSDDLLDASDLGFSLSIAGIVGLPWDETHPSTIMQVSIGHRRFLGLPALNPAFHLNVSTNADGRSGTFSAEHLLAQPNEPVTVQVYGQANQPADEPAGEPAIGAPLPQARIPADQQPSDVMPGQRAAINLKGSWRCSANATDSAVTLRQAFGRIDGQAPAADEDASRVTGRMPGVSDANGSNPNGRFVAGAFAPLTMKIRPPAALTGESEPVDAPPRPPVAPVFAATESHIGHFRLFHAQPCFGPSCRSWAATDLRSHKTVRATVRFGHVHLAPSLAASVESGLVELWITGRTRLDSHGRLRISAIRLDGVVPRVAQPVFQLPPL